MGARRDQAGLARKGWGRNIGLHVLVADTEIRVNMASRSDLLENIERRFAAGHGFAVATLNLDHLVKLKADPAFRAAYARQDFVTADGNPIVWLARLAGGPVDLLPGSDLVRPVLRLAARMGLPVGFLGSTEASLAAAATVLAAEIPGLEVRARVSPPMGFDPESPETLRILDEMAAAGVRLILLALGAPKQEVVAAWGRIHRPELAFLSIGAGLDFVSGAQRRAPGWARRLALEWLWRAAREPRRLGLRYLRCAIILPGHAWRAFVQGRRRGSGVAPLLR